MKRSLGDAGELFPQSVFIIASYDEDGVPNAMNAAWAGECTRHEICFNIGDHKTTENIVRKGAFTVAPADADNVVTADYFGIATGNKVDKAEKSGLTFTRSEHVDAPVIEEYPLTMECEVTAIDGDEHGARIVGRVVNVLVDEEILGVDGKVDFGKWRPLVYDAAHMTYRVVGEEVGRAWNVGKPLV
ncbi:flavin reductase family protein [Thermophilibacter provencensis]|uniref:Flavin reductase family protein n=1 Tax=Thermophilibacter provencensis TaxID=1852386 RepID=A0A921GIP9_9ACTN|nr:flavin reductase family protein [Thermophilibacter provencensis]HJF45868.1 flavin reductase family protein [Thermophilibacter provencensis]